VASWDDVPVRIETDVINSSVIEAAELFEHVIFQFYLKARFFNSASHDIRVLTTETMVELIRSENGADTRVSFVHPKLKIKYHNQWLVESIVLKPMSDHEEIRIEIHEPGLKLGTSNPHSYKAVVNIPVMGQKLIPIEISVKRQVLPIVHLSDGARETLSALPEGYVRRLTDDNIRVLGNFLYQFRENSLRATYLSMEGEWFSLELFAVAEESKWHGMARFPERLQTVPQGQSGLVVQGAAQTNRVMLEAIAGILRTVGLDARVGGVNETLPAGWVSILIPHIF